MIEPDGLRNGVAVMCVNDYEDSFSTLLRVVPNRNTSEMLFEDWDYQADRFSTVKDTPSKINIYIDGYRLYIQNLTSNNKNLLVSIL